MKLPAFFLRLQDSLRRFRWDVLAWGLLAAATSHWLAMGMLHEFRHLLHIPDGSLPLALTALFLAFVLAFVLYRIHHGNPWPRGKGAIAAHLLLAWGVFASGLWFAVTLEAALKDLVEPTVGVWSDAVLALVGALGFVLLTPRYSRLRDRFEGVRDIERQATRSTTDGDTDTLILFLSTPNLLPELPGGETETDGRPHAQIRFRGGAAALLMGRSPAEDIAAISAAAGDRDYWNWQQLLRAIAPFRGLSSIWIIGSSNAAGYRDETVGDGGASSSVAVTGFGTRSGKGSFEFLGLCRELIAPYTTATVNLYPEPVDFENFQALSGSVGNLLRNQLADVPPEHVVVDVTGGTKVTSIVAAILTQNRGTRFQYVETQPDFDVIRYRLVQERAPSPHGH